MQPRRVSTPAEAVHPQVRSKERAMAGNKAVVYKGPGLVAVENIPYPTLEVADGPGVNPANVGRACSHGVILKVVSTNICGSDQHMVRGRTTAPEAWLSLIHI